MPQILPAAFCPLGQAGMTRTCGTPGPYLLSLGQASRRGFGYHTALQALTLGRLDVSSFLNVTVLVSSGEAGPCHSWSNMMFTCCGSTLCQDWKCKCVSCHEGVWKPPGGSWRDAQKQSHHKAAHEPPPSCRFFMGWKHIQFFVENPLIKKTSG